MSQFHRLSKVQIHVHFVDFSTFRLHPKDLISTYMLTGLNAQLYCVNVDNNFKAKMVNISKDQPLA